MRASLVALLCLAALGCDPPERPPPPPPFDAGPRMDASLDSGPVVRRDGGPTAPVIDGTIGDAEWRGAVEATADTPTDREGSTLTRLLARIEDDQLFVAVEGTLAATDTLVLYVDDALGAADGVGDLAALVDEDGTLDRAISGPLATPESFRADLAWGTTMMPRTPVGLDEEAGWRILGTTPSFFWIASEVAPTVCGEAACETAIPLSELGGEAPRRIAMFARIVLADGTWANQTLPMDDPDAPGIVNALLTIDDGTIVADGGVPDAGVDAATPTIVIDGRMDPTDEWAAAARYDQSVVAVAPFAGSSAETLWVVRDATRLRVAIRATLGSNQALVMYVDHDVAGPDGLASPTALDDFVGALDTALSKTLITPAELRMDAAWGTLDMGRTAVVGDDRMGWRSVGPNPSAYANLAGATVCGADLCELEITLSELGVAPSAEIGLFVRLVSATSVAFSNQTLPLDDALAPEIVSVYASLPAP